MRNLCFVVVSFFVFFFALNSFSVENAFAQDARNWNLVKDSLLNDEGIVMPDSNLLPTIRFVKDGRCEPGHGFEILNSRGSYVRWHDHCDIEMNDSVLHRNRFVDVRTGHPKRILVIQLNSFTVPSEGELGEPLEPGCLVWVNKGFWEGKEPNDSFSLMRLIRDQSCVENFEKFELLINALALRL